MAKGNKGTKERGMVKWWVLIGIVLVLVLLIRKEGFPPPEGLSLAELEAEIIPVGGKFTAYGMPISWDNAQTFADWYYEVRLNPEEAQLLQKALGPISTPCCDDTRLTRCCCEKEGLICNLVRSARGLGAWLIRQGFTAEKTQEAVEEWLRFAHRDYYLAKALKERGISPTEFGLPTRGACYRQACELPLRQGGCGGMGSWVKL